MDAYSLALANTSIDARPMRMDARAEDRYYALHSDPLRLLPALFRSLTTLGAFCIVLLIVSHLV